MKRVSSIFIGFYAFLGILVLLSPPYCGAATPTKAIGLAENQFVQLSMDLLMAVREKKSVSSFQEQLANVNPATLANALTNDAEKQAFWINIYNANIQLLLNEKPELYQNKGKFFRSKAILIAGRLLGFDDIEHGIIRSSKFKWSLGWVRNPFAGKFEKRFRLSKVDPRIHFALNCGAKSCPPIAVYSGLNFNRQLDQVAKQFVNASSNFQAEESKVKVSSLFSWFRGDFGGKKGALKLLEGYGVIPENSKVKLAYTKYDWTLDLGNYLEDNDEQ